MAAWRTPGQFCASAGAASSKSAAAAEETVAENMFDVEEM